MRNSRTNFAQSVLALRAMNRPSSEEELEISMNVASRVSFAQSVLASRTISRNTSEDELQIAKRVTGKFHSYTKTA